MKSISIDFSNNMVCILAEGQQGTKLNPDLKRAAFNSFIPEQYRERGSYTWDFDADTFSVNQDYMLKDGCIITKDCFVPETTIAMEGLHGRFDEFVAIMGYGKSNVKEATGEEDLFSAFSTQSRIQIQSWLHGYHNGTKRTYLGVLMNFLSYLHKDDPADVSYNEVCSYLKEELPKRLHSSRYKLSTYRQSVYGILSFYRHYWRDRPELAEALAEEAGTIPSAPLPDTRILPSAEDVHNILRYLSKFSRYQEYLLVYLSYECCLSLNECLTLRVDGIRRVKLKTAEGTVREACAMTVKPPGGSREREIEIPDETLSLLSGLAPMTCGNSPYLLGANGDRLQERGIQARLRRSMIRLVNSGVIKKAYCVKEIRTAGLHRYIQDASDPYRLSNYASLTPQYMFRLASTSSADVVGLPVRKRKFSVLPEELSGQAEPAKDTAEESKKRRSKNEKT